MINQGKTKSSTYYSVAFNIYGYDGFIDFIKAYAILCVLFGHTFGPIIDKLAYGVWAGMQVPLFVLVQSFHAYKKDKSTLRIVKIFTRVLLPFIVFEVITFLIALFVVGDSFELLKNSLLMGGGYGPGSYYPWVYVQVALLLPIFYFVLNRYSKLTAFIIFFIICEGFELLFSYLDLPSHIYRLLASRYIFLFYFGWQWAKEGIKVNGTTILLSILSLLTIIYFEYFSVDTEPWFINAGFKFHRWPCYFWVAYGLASILYFVWNKLNRFDIIVKSVKMIAKASYEIFLIQMSTIYLFKIELLKCIPSVLLRNIVWIINIWVVSLCGGIYLNKVINRRTINTQR